MNPVFELLVPPINQLFAFENGVWRVCYHNGGKYRFSSELTAVYDGEKHIFHLSGGQKLDRASFEAYRRQRWPLPYEVGRNDENITLGVKSATSPSKTNL